VGLDPEVRDELVDAWRAWDKDPAWPSTVARRIDAEHAAAAGMGWDWLPLSRALRAARLHGFDHDEAVSLVDQLYDAGEHPAW
jgi:hypothetical protein